MKVELLKLKHHPRILEVRFLSIYFRMERALGAEKTDSIILKICEDNGIQPNIMSSLISSISQIEHAVDPSSLHSSQEYILAGMLWGDKRSVIAVKDLGVGTQYIYQDKRRHNPDYFVDSVWLERLGKNTKVASIENYYRTLQAFLPLIKTYLSIL